MKSYISLDYSTPHGLYRVTDSRFYVVPWNNPMIYEYNLNQTTSNWTQTIFVNPAVNTSIYGAHVTIDDCDRRWLTLHNYGIKIYDENGNSLGDLTGNGGYFDTLILDNYVLVLSHYGNSIITRIDPQVQCDLD